MSSHESGSMRPCVCGHPEWCHDTFVPNPDPQPGGSMYVLGEPGECNHVGPGGWDCDCLQFTQQADEDED